jgi:dihydroxy-acid dehydratase
MPEIANVALPARLLAQGVRDMVRISDARMSGTSYGTVVLHVSPEAALGGPLALVQDGDMIVLDVAARRLDLEVPESELESRRAAWSAPAVSGTSRGYLRLHVEHVLGAHLGADLDFLRGGSGADVPRQAF